MTLVMTSLLALATTAGEPGWVSLFDGVTLAGWRAAESQTSFRVVDGTIVADGPRSHLFYVGADGRAAFRNFEFEAEAKTTPSANSGIYFATAFQASGFPSQGFEAQVCNSAPERNGYQELKLTGSLYAVRNVHKPLVADGEWFKMAISVHGRRIQIRLNDVLVADYVEPVPPVTDPARPGRKLGAGTFALQCHDPESRVSFRNLRVKPLPDDLAEPVTEPVVDDLFRQTIGLAVANFPLIDFHTHLKGGLTLAEVVRHQLDTGINHGIAVNGGIGFPITSDAGIEAFRQSMQGSPCWLALQCEGREWMRLFSTEAIAKFDYVFTDSMTIVDHRGQRARLWIPEEVVIDEPQAFMDRLVTTIEGIMAREPIDIYVNPTFLPEVLAARYDELWTPERMDRVIAAARQRGVAIEINSRLKIPSVAFVKRAKAAGIKFTLGTNNTDKTLARLEYALDVVKQCGLGWKDMWMPKPDGQKPVQVHAKEVEAMLAPPEKHVDTMLPGSPVTFPAQGALPALYPCDQPAKDGTAPEPDYFLFSTPERSLAQVKTIQAAMPAGSFTAPAKDWANLPRTRRILTEGGDLHLLGLGDSIVNDTMRSGWLSLLAEAYPKAHIKGTVYVRGGGGCQHYRDADRIARFVVPRKPDVVYIGGISQASVADIREVIGQLRRGLPEVEILLATGTFGTWDPRDARALALAPHSGTGQYGRDLRALAAETKCAYLDMTLPWAEYLRSAGVHPHRFYRDVVHANEFGEQVLAKVMMGFWAPA